MESRTTSNEAEPRGIVIRYGSEKPADARFWAYMWTADEETSDTHWHQLVPITKSLSTRR
jgi:hypothetical protein